MNNLLIVIDTNVLVSALLSKHSDSSTVKVLEALFKNDFIPLYNDEIIKEYKEVLIRDKFNFNIELVKILINFIIENGINVERTKTNELFIDLSDLVFYEVCMSKSDENSFLVTVNIKHFPERNFIISPADLIKTLENEKEDF